MRATHIFAAGIAAIGLLGLFSVAGAHPVYKKEFDARYLQKGTPLHEAWKGAGHCNACHVGGGDDRKHLNAYGQAIDKFLDKEDADALTVLKRKRDPARAAAAEKKIREALESVEKMPSDPADPKSPTFGELIQTGKLPISPEKLPAE